MKRKVIMAIVAVGVFASNIASAESVKIAEGGTTVCVYDKGEKDTDMVLFVVKAGESIDDNDNVYAVSFATTDDNGNAEFIFDMPDNKNGTPSDDDYDLYIKQENKILAKYENALTYASVNTRLNLMNTVHLAEDLNEIIKDENKTALKAIGCKYDMLTDDIKSKVIEMLGKYDEEIAVAGEDGFSDIFNSTLMVVKMNCDNDSTAYGEYLKIINPEFEKDFYNEIENSVLIEWISECMYQNKEYSSVDEMQRAYKVANILYKIDNARVDDIEELLIAYADILGIEEERAYKDYCNLANKHSADEKLIIAFKSTNVYKVSDLLDIISNSIKANKPSTSVGGGSSGGKATSSGNTGQYIYEMQGKTKTQEKPCFVDISEEHWAYTAAESLANKGIISGDEKGNFRAEDAITREEFVKMLVLAAGVFDENAECYFADVSKDAWYYKYIASGYKAGIVSGISEETFGVGNEITRQDMMVLVGRSTDRFTKIREYIVFSDESDISDYAKSEIIKLYEAGIANGMEENTFVPLGTATRAQGAQIIYNSFIK